MNRAFSLDWSPNALSPTTTNAVLKKNVKKVEELKEQLQVEITEKNELSEENVKLKSAVDSLNQKIKAKTLENQKLKDDIEDLQRSWEVAVETSTNKRSSSPELNLVKSELSELKKYNADLERENEEARSALGKHEEKVQSLVSDLVSLEQQHEELKLKFFGQEDLLQELQNRGDNYRTEISDLKECNQALREETSRLELRYQSRKSSDFQNNECLERELEFQFMKDKIEQMTKNLHTIEDEQAKLIALNLELSDDKASLSTALEELKLRNVSMEDRYSELNGNFISLQEQNECLKNENDRKNMKIEDAERAIDDCNRKFNATITEYSEMKSKLLAERREIETNFAALAEELHLVSQQLEEATNENRTYEVTLHDSKVALQTKSAEFDSLLRECEALMRDKKSHAKHLQLMEEELQSVCARNNELQAKIRSAHDDIEKLDKKCEFLTRSNDSYAESLTDANYKILTLSDAKSEITAYLEQLKIRHHKLQDDNCTLNMRVDDLVVENVNYASMMKNLKSQLQTKSDELQMLTEQHRILSNDFEALTESNSSYLRLLQEAEADVHKLESVKGDLEVRLTNSQSECEKLNGENSSLTDRYSKLQESEKQANDRVTVLNNDNAALVMELDKLKTNLDESLAKYSAAVAENEHLEKLIAAANNEHKIIQTNLGQLRITYNKLSVDHNKLTGHYKEAVSKRDELFEQLRQRDISLETMALELAAQTTRYEEAVAEQNRLVAANEGNLDELKSVELKLNLTNEMLQKAEQGYLQTTESLRAVTEELDTLKMDHKQLVDVMESATVEIARLNAEKTDLHVRCDEMSLNSIQQNQLLNELESRSQRLATEKADVEMKLTEEISQLTNLIGELKEKEVSLSESSTALTAVNLRLQNEVDDLTRSLNTTVEWHAEMAELNQQLNAENEKLREQMATSHERLQNLMIELDDSKVEMEKLAENMRSAEANIRASKIENAELKIHIACKSAEREELQERVNKLTTETASLNDMVKSLTELNADLCSQNGKLGRRVIEVESALEQLELDKQNRLTELESKTQEVQDKVELVESLTHHVQSLENDLATTTQENGTLADRFATMQKEFLDADQRIKDIEASNSEYSNSVQLMDKQIQDLHLERDLSHNQLRQLETVLAGVRGELDAATQERATLLANVTKLENLNYELREKNASLQTECRQLEEGKTNALNDLREMLVYQIEQLQASNDELKIENGKLSDINQEKLLCLKEVDKHMEVLESFNAGLTTENAELKQRVEECYQSESNWRNENTRLAQAIRSLENENEQLQNRLKESGEHEDSLNSQIQSLQNEEKDAKELRKLVTLELQNKDTLQQEMAKLQQQNGKLRAEIEKLGRHIDALDEERESMKREYGLELGTVVAELEDLRSCVRDKDSTIRELMEKAASVRRENESLADDVQRLELENSKSRAQLEELSKQKEELYEVDKINQDAFQKQVEAMTSRNEGLLNQVAELRGSLEELQLENESLKIVIDDAQVKINDLNRAHAAELDRSMMALEDECKHAAMISTQLELLVTETRRHENEREELLKRVETLTAKLAEESQRVNMMQRSHSSQLQKQIEANKSLETKLHHYESVEKETLCKRIHELKTKLEEVLETNEEERTRTKDYVMLVKENENLLLKIDQLETAKQKLEAVCDELLEEKDEHRQAEEELSARVRNVNEMLKNQKDENARLTEEYNIYKAEYRKIVKHKDEMVSEYKEAVAEENRKLSQKCEDLEKVNREKEQIVEDQEQVIRTLTAKIEDLEVKWESGDKNEPKLNETRVVASGLENEVYAALRLENLKLLEEKDSYTKKILGMEMELEKEKELYRNKARKLYEKISQKIVAEYEGKLQRAKTEYQKIVTQKYEARDKEWRKKEEEYKMMLGKEKDHIKDLSSQLWDISDRYLQQKQFCETRLSEGNLYSPATMLRKTRSATQLNLVGSRGSLVPDNERRLSTMSTMSEDVHLPSRRRPTMTISAKVFPTEDEEQEIFDNACLADLKQGRMQMEDSTDFSKQRMSILQARNSLCPPHLKSSYPAETQFLPLQEFKENDIKMGSENDISDIENLLPGDRQRKNRNQTSYKKPGPPTPSKNGGRSTQCGNVTPRNVLKESNDNGNGRRKSFTPKFFNNLFALRGHATVTIPTTTQQDENLPVTPRRNRLSSIRRRFSRNPQEFGNTNSGFC